MLKLRHINASLNNENSEFSSLFFIVLRISLLSVLLLTFSALSGCQKNSQATVFTGDIMGTQYRITVISDDVTKLGADNLDKVQLEAQLLEAMEKVNQSMSTYIGNSELSLFNQAPANTPIELSSGLYYVIKQALDVSKVSDGAFDITVGPLVDLWGFGPKPVTRDEKTGLVIQPNKQQLDSVKRVVGYQYLTLTEQKLSKKQDKVHIDLSAIAKGYAVDMVADKLLELGIDNFLVDIGGELKTRGCNAQGKIWTIAIEKPHVTGGIQQIIHLDDIAIATSGDYRNFIEIDGVKYSHTIDPRQFKPVHHKLASVSVIDQQTSKADALATTLMVMGEAGIEFAKKNNLAAYFILRPSNEQSQEYRIVYTDAFKPYLEH